MTKAAPDPRAVREASLDEVERLGLPLPPPGFPLIWEPGDTVELDPTAPPEDRLMSQMPDLPAGETFGSWRSRSLMSPRDPIEAAILLDLYYCLDWGFQEAARIGMRPPGEI